MEEIIFEKFCFVMSVGYPIVIDCEISFDEEMMFLFDEQIIFVCLRDNTDDCCLSFGKYKDVKEELQDYKEYLCIEESVICGQFKDGNICYITMFIIKKNKNIRKKRGKGKW